MNIVSVSKKSSRDLATSLSLLIKTFGALLVESNPVFKELYEEYKIKLSARDPARSKARLHVSAVRFCVKSFFDYFQEKQGKVLYNRSVVDKIKQSGRITYNPFMVAKIISMIDGRSVDNIRWKYSCSWVGDEKKIAEG